MLINHYIRSFYISVNESLFLISEILLDACNSRLELFELQLVLQIKDLIFYAIKLVFQVIHHKLNALTLDHININYMNFFVIF